MRRANLECTSCIGRLFKFLPSNLPYITTQIVHHNITLDRREIERERESSDLQNIEAMVSFEASLSPINRNTISEFDNLSKKRKWEEPQGEESFDKKLKAESTKSIFDIELHLETPLPLEWQRCLDIQSGQIHFYNTRTQKRTSRDPRRSPEPPSHMSLDLELNLPCDSPRKNQANDHFTKHNSSSPPRGFSDLFMLSRKQKENSGGLTRSPSWLASEGDQQEMVATVCVRCHMLVMLCKSSPACPNCKFMHPPDQSSPKLFKQGLSLLC